MALRRSLNCGAIVIRKQANHGRIGERHIGGFVRPLPVRSDASGEVIDLEKPKAGGGQRGLVPADRFEFRYSPGTITRQLSSTATTAPSAIKP